MSIFKVIINFFLQNMSAKELQAFMDEEDITPEDIEKELGWNADDIRKCLSGDKKIPEQLRVNLYNKYRNPFG